MIARPWTDDLPKCRNTCVASYFSRIRSNSNSSDDYLCFYCQTEDNFCLYGVFEPHNGLDAARFIMQRMAAEILFPTPSANTDEEIRDRLRTADRLTARLEFSSYCRLWVFVMPVASRTCCCPPKGTGTWVTNAGTQHKVIMAADLRPKAIQMGLRPYHVARVGCFVAFYDNLTPAAEISQNCDNILSRLKEIDQHLSAGATVVIALVHNNKLFVANVGETRALLCKTDDNSVLRVVQLTVDHSLNNEDELLRLAQLGLDVNKLRNAQYLGNQTGTRCLGNYLVKGLYKAFPTISAASAEPVIATPEIHGPILLDDSCRFLILVSAGVYKRIQEAKGSSEQTNKQLSQIIVENFRKQTDFRQVSQSVLQEIEEEFVSYCVKNNLTPKSNTHMSLLIRNFNFLTPITENITRNASVRFNPIVQSKSNTLLNEIDSEIYSSGNENELNVDTNRSIESSSDIYPSGRQFDRDRKIKGYVDFSCYYENVAKARKNGTLPDFIK